MARTLPLTETREFLNAAAERMRLAPTKSEAKLRKALERLGFRFQYPLLGETKNGGRWGVILDFFHPEARLCIEVDGGVHKRQRGRDRRRDGRLRVLGIRTIRIPNRRVLTELDALLADIAQRVRVP